MAKLNPAFGELYDTAVEHLQRGAGGMGRIVTIANCVREIANNLAGALGDADGQTLPPRVDMSAPVRRLGQAWEAAQLGFVAEPTTSSGDYDSGDFIDGIEDGRIDQLRFLPVPADVYYAAQAVVSAHRTATGNARRRETAIIGRSDAGNDPTARLWSLTLAFFLDYAHLDRAASQAVPAEEELNERFATFEAIIRGRIGDFFAIKPQIADLLDIANRRREPDEGEGLSPSEVEP